MDGEGKPLMKGISTHTLRKEGDRCSPRGIRNIMLFQPTPSARRVTKYISLYAAVDVISTHTLRKEGDRDKAG